MAKYTQKATIAKNAQVQKENNVQNLHILKIKDKDQMVALITQLLR